jgi:ABC-type transport system involved in cytochrome c biogenesis permease subunit
MTDADQRFALRAIRRKRLFLALSIAGLAIAFALAILYCVLWWRNPAFPIAPRAVIVLLVLLNARQNLRQYKYARILAGFMGRAAP